MRAEVVEHNTATTYGTEYLCLFLHRLLGFRIPDLESVAETHGVDLNRIQASFHMHACFIRRCNLHLAPTAVAAALW